MSKRKPAAPVVSHYPHPDWIMGVRRGFALDSVRGYDDWLDTDEQQWLDGYEYGLAARLRWQRERPRERRPRVRVASPVLN